MKHDYKAALEAFEKDVKAGYALEYGDDVTIATRHALAMMQKLQEPSQNMLHAGVDFDTYKLGDISPLGFRISPQQLCEGILKAMLKQAEKEIEK